jgi:hypothetical protein
MTAHHQDGQATAWRRYAQAEEDDGNPRFVNAIITQYTAGQIECKLGETYVNRK